MDDPHVQRAWDTLVHEVVDAKDAVRVGVLELIEAEQALARTGDLTPEVEVRAAEKRVVAARDGLSAANDSVVSAQQAMKAGVPGSDQVAPKPGKGK